MFKYIVFKCFTNRSVWHLDAKVAVASSHHQHGPEAVRYCSVREASYIAHFLVPSKAVQHQCNRRVGRQAITLAAPGECNTTTVWQCQRLNEVQRGVLVDFATLERKH